MRTKKEDTKSKDEGKNMTLRKEDEELKLNRNLEVKPEKEGKMESFTTDVAIKKDEGTDLESVLRELKIFGRYHIKFMFLIGMLSLGSMWHSTNYVFAVENVGYRCKYPHCGYKELSKLPLNTTFDYKCHKYKLLNNNGDCDEDNFDASNATDCEEWVYDRPDSFVAEFNLGCEDWKRTLVGTMHSVGYMLGLFLVGPLSDKFGRKYIIIFTSVACAVIGLCKSVVYSYWLYIALETIEPILGDCYSATFTLAIETVTKEHRPLLIFILCLFTTTGGMVLALIAWLTPSWRIYLIAIYYYILYIFWMDESIRWLLNKGKKVEVDNIFRQAAKTNKIIIDENKLANLKCDENSPIVSLSTLVKMTFSSKKLFLRLLCCICMWFTALFNAYSLLINSVSLEGNKYLNYGLTVMTGLPASVAILYLLMKCKRKKPLIFSFLLTGSFCIAHSLIPTDYAWLSILLYISGKFCSTIAIRIVYIYTSELFPTYTRNTMHALCSALGRVAAIIAPQTPLLLQYWSGLPSLIMGILSLLTACVAHIFLSHWSYYVLSLHHPQLQYWSGLPSLIMGILSLLTACVVILLPDTSDDVLPDNVGQAETLGKHEKNIEACPLEKKKKHVEECSKL